MRPKILKRADQNRRNNSTKFNTAQINKSPFNSFVKSVQSNEEPQKSSVEKDTRNVSHDIDQTGSFDLSQYQRQEISLPKERPKRLPQYEEGPFHQGWPYDMTVKRFQLQ